MKRALLDLSSIVWTCLMAGVDKEHGKQAIDEAGVPMVNGKGNPIIINSAGYGYDNCINHIVEVMADLRITPRQMIIVKEGMNSKQGRQALLSTYKAGRDKLPGQYEQFNLCKDQLIEMLLGLGAQMCWQDAVEADDVIGYLAKHLKGEVWIVSGDKDLAQCVGGDVHHYRAGARDENPFGPFAHRLIPTYIALVGDNTDKIPGAKNFGEKKAEKLLLTFGEEGLELMEGLIRKKDLKALARDGDVNEMKELQLIVDDASNVYISYELGRLRTERVNTMKRPLNWRVGFVKPREQCEEQVLRRYAGVNKLVSAENYDEALEFFKRQLSKTPEFALDIETSTPEESDEWLRLQGKEDGVDVFGSELTGMSITFGDNCQFTYYLTHEHVEEEGVTNLTREQVRDLVALIPKDKINWVHNNAFELPVLYNEWGADWADDPEWHGFLPNVRDTKIASSYADENRTAKLKELSKEVLGYDQQTYEATTTATMKKSSWNGVGRVKSEWTDKIEVGTGEYEQIPVCNDEGDPVFVDGVEITTIGPEITKFVDGDEMVKVQYKMNQLTANQVVGYGCDDTICTVGLANHFQVIMEIEDTIDTFHEVETFPAYLTALGFVQGVEFSHEDMREMEKEDDVAYDKAWATLRDYLMEIGFDGTRCPVFEEITGPTIKEAHLLLTGAEFKTQVRTPSKIAKLLDEAADTSEAAGEDDYASVVRLLAVHIAANDLSSFNALVAANFSGEPKLDLASPKQMKRLLYEFIGIPVQIINDVTPTERKNKPELADAVKKFKQKRAGKSVVMTDEEMELLRAKAKTDDTSIEYALAFDQEYIDEKAKAALLAIGTIKKVMTRRSLFYKNYWGIKHWKDGRIHSSANQCAAVTRRYSMSNPNLQQLPKKGEGVKFRGCFKPHDKDSVVCSIDFTGQELRLAAERSQDPNMLACYIGENLKDIHSITAAGAMRLKWGNDEVDALTKEHGGDLALGLTTEEFEYRLFLKLRGIGKAQPIGKKADDLRKDSKNVNFAAQFGGRAAKLSETLIMRLEDAQLFLDARAKMFPEVDKAAERAADKAKELGYATTMMGARRHLRHALMSEEYGEADRAARQAWNMEIQGSAGEMTKLAMARMWKRGIFFRYRVRFFAPIHDEIVSSVHRDDALAFIREKHECMVQPYSTMRVPILASISVGPDFAQQIECGDWYIADNIAKAVNDSFDEKLAA
jgi:5'-3' exonuclease